MPNILVIDDEHSIRESFSLILEGDYNVTLAASGEAGLKAVSSQKQDLVFLDCRMPGMNGLETLKRIKEIEPQSEVVMVTAVNDVQKASEAIKLGARDYIVKPFDVDLLLNLTEQILRRRAIANVTRKNKKHGELPGNSEVLKRIISQISKISGRQQVAICGEAGTEKEPVAKFIHGSGKRSDKPFLTLNLSPKSSITKTKQLLFGFEKGSSTIDLEAKSGLLEEAADGTMFINNYDLLPDETKNIIASSQYTRLGGQNKMTINCQIIVGSTNKDITAEVKFLLPPLRERPSDIIVMAHYFIEKHNRFLTREIEFEKNVIDALAGFSWPGNYDQLSLVIKQLILTSQNGKATLQDLPIEILTAYKTNAGNNSIADFEKKYIKAVYHKEGLNKERAAASLNVSRNLLTSKL